METQKFDFQNCGIRNKIAGKRYGPRVMRAVGIHNTDAGRDRPLYNDLRLNDNYLRLSQKLRSLPVHRVACGTGVGAAREPGWVEGCLNPYRRCSKPSVTIHTAKTSFGLPTTDYGYYPDCQNTDPTFYYDSSG